MTHPKPNPWTRPLLLSLPVVALLASGVAHAAANDDIRTVDVEVVDAQKGTTETTRMTVALDGQRSSKLSIPIGDYQYFVDARCEPALSGHVPTTIKVKRTDLRPGSPGRIDVESGAAVSPGVRTVVATVSRPDGSRIEVAIRIH
ncbi:MAG: hypothetical protein ACXWUG_06060 [Polyangiales bacterium]